MKVPIGNSPQGSPARSPQGQPKGSGISSFRKPVQEAGTGAAPTPMAPPKKRKENTRAMKIIDLITKVSIYLTVFLLPLFFLPNVPSVLDLNKQALLVIVVGIGFLAWVGKMAWRNEIRFRSNFILIPVVVLLFIFGLSAVFSNYREQSFWGYFGGESEAFITLLFMVALFVLIFNNIKNKKDAVKLILTFLVSGFLVSLYGLLQLYQVYAVPNDAFKNPFFNSVGSVYIFSVYVGALFLLTVSMFLSDISKILKIALIVLSIFFFFVLMLINFKIVWWIILFMLALLLGITIIRGKKSESQARVLPMVYLVLALLMVLRSQPIIRMDLPVEVLLNHKTSASIAFSSLKENPLLGSGPTTFVSVYKAFRPDNLGDFWSVNFNGASSYFFTLMSTTGVLGTLAFLFLVGIGIIYFVRNLLKAVAAKGEETEGDYIAIGAGLVWLFTTIILFTYMANMTILMLWWFSFALFLSFSFFDPRMRDKEFVTTSATPRSSLLLSFVFVLIIIGFVAAIYLQSQKYIAAAHFNKALVLDAQGEEIQRVTDRVNKALELDPNRDVYFRNMSVALFALANQRVAEKGQDLTAEDSNYVSSMISGSLQSADRSRLLDDSNSDNHLAVAQIYEGVLITMEGADENAIKNYEEAVKYDPNNPALYQRLANIYITLADVAAAQAQAQSQDQSTELPEESKQYLALARENINKALEIKPDFISAHLALVGVHEREGNMDKAIEKELENKAMFPRDPGMAFRVGLLYYKDEQFSKAQEEFEYALSLDENFANALYFLGLSLDQQGDKQAALVRFEKVAELNPDNEEVKKVIDNLKNGRDALDGIGPETQQGQSAQGEATEEQPSINPDVEQQEIPEEATPSPEEVNPPEEQQPAEEQ